MRRWPPPSAGDTVVVSEFRQLAGSARDVLILLHRLYSAKVEFASLRENFHTATGAGAGNPSGLVRPGRNGGGADAPAARKMWKRPRRPAAIKAGTPLAIDEEKFRAVCTRWRAGEMTAVAAMRLLGLKPNTFYRRVKDLGL